MIGDRDLFSMSFSQIITIVESLKLTLQETGNANLKTDTSKTFEKFIVENNKNFIPKAVLMDFAAIQRNKIKSIFLTGPIGSGKTHLLNAFVNSNIEKFNNGEVVFISARNLMDEMIEHMKRNRISEFYKGYTENVEIFIVDDIDELKNKIGTQEQLLQIFNGLCYRNKLLIFSSFNSPENLEGISEKLRSRLAGGLVLQLEEPDSETCISILRSIGQSYQIKVDDKLLRYIISKTGNNPRALESSILKIKTTADVLKMDIDLGFIKACFEH